MTRTLVVPAAGRGTRLGSALPKVLTEVGGRPMLDWILDRHRPFCAHVVLVVHPDDRAVVERYTRGRPEPMAIAEQAAATGMLDAILCGRERALTLPGDRIWITWCDQVLISRGTVDRLADCEGRAPNPAAAFPTCRQVNPYIHFDRATDGTLLAVRQRREGDEMPPVGESDAGLFSLARETLVFELPAFAQVAPRGPITRERNFLPFLPWLAKRAPVLTFDVPPHEALGVNTPDDRIEAARRLAETS
jgi:bifunctional UDP-N-acetylglucosamine pyrophosphorylase/glucosamine-1-phosphate N-acetyltransferase